MFKMSIMKLFLTLTVLTLSEAAYAEAALSASLSPQGSARSSIQFLSERMDQYHKVFPVYDDVSSPGNHFLVFAKIPAGSTPVTVNASWTESRHSGATSIRCEFQDRGASFGGFIFMNGILPAHASSPRLNFGDVDNAGIDLSGARVLTFWARGETGGEKVEFFMGGVGRDAFTGAPTVSYPDSTPRHPRVGTVFTLAKKWKNLLSG